MSPDNLTQKEIVELIRSVFPGMKPGERMGILVDLPHHRADDHDNWRNRRKIAGEWCRALREGREELGLKEVSLIAYPAVKANNADLPDSATVIPDILPETAGDLPGSGEVLLFDTIFRTRQVFLAPTEQSATAPLKIAARTHGFRAATMPGFSPRMIPALRIDYQEVARRCGILKNRLDRATGARVVFRSKGDQVHRVFFDLRFRKAHLSSARFPDPGTAGNLPSGETYIVPYEGEREEKSRTRGVLPVQIGKEMLFFTIEGNRAVSVAGEGPEYERERNFLSGEPAYGNMGELGFGVLKDFGLSPINEILLDEKLGFHVAFGRSDHFGGIVAPSDFSSPDHVIHLDRIYIPATQPDILVESIVLEYEDAPEEKILKGGEYLLF